MKTKIAICVLSALISALTLTSCGFTVNVTSNSSENSISTSSVDATTETTTKPAEGGGGIEASESTTNNESVTNNSVAGQSSASESQAASDNSVSSAESQASESSSEEIDYDAILKPLLTRLHEVDMIGGGALTYDETTMFTAPGTQMQYAKVVDSRFSTVADLSAFVSEYLTDNMINQRYPYLSSSDSTQFIDVDGSLYMNVGGRGCGFFWTFAPAQISNATDTSFTAVVEYEDFNDLSYLQLGIVKVGNGWKIDSFSWM